MLFQSPHGLKQMDDKFRNRHGTIQATILMLIKTKLDNQYNHHFSISTFWLIKTHNNRPLEALQGANINSSKQRRM
jgi:hypothetical protein